MRLITKVNIDFATWQEQASRFVKGDGSLITRTLPQNTVMSGKGEIRIERTKPLEQGFDAIITYVQHYTKEIQINEETISVSKDLEIIKYQKFIDYETVKTLLAQVAPLVDASITGHDRTVQQILQATLMDIVSKKTFGGLQKGDYTIEV